MDSIKYKPSKKNTKPSVFHKPSVKREAVLVRQDLIVYSSMLAIALVLIRSFITDYDRDLAYYQSSGVAWMILRTIAFVEIPILCGIRRFRLWSFYAAVSLNVVAIFTLLLSGSGGFSIGAFEAVVATILLIPTVLLLMWSKDYSERFDYKVSIGTLLSCVIFVIYQWYNAGFGLYAIYKQIGADVNFSSCFLRAFGLVIKPNAIVSASGINGVPMIHGYFSAFVSGFMWCSIIFALVFGIYAWAALERGESIFIAAIGYCCVSVAGMIAAFAGKVASREEEMLEEVDEETENAETEGVEEVAKTEVAEVESTEESEVETAEEAESETVEEAEPEPVEEEVETTEEVAESAETEIAEEVETVEEEETVEEAEAETAEEVAEESEVETTEEVEPEIVEETVEEAETETETAVETVEEPEVEPETTEEVAETKDIPETAEETVEEVEEVEEEAEAAEETVEESETSEEPEEETAEAEVEEAVEEEPEADYICELTGDDLAKALVYTYPINFEGFSALDRRTKIFEGNAVKGIIPYTYVGKEAIVKGGPICRDQDMPALIDEFKQMCIGKKLSISVINASEHVSELLCESGFDRIRNGAEPVFDLNKLKARNAKAKAAQDRQIKKKYGITIAEYKYYDIVDQDVEAKMIELSDNWLDQRNAPKFTIYKRRQRDAFLPSILEFDNDIKVGNDVSYDGFVNRGYRRRYFYAVDNSGAMKGLLVFCPLGFDNGYACEAGRRTDDAPKNIMELLMHEAFEVFKGEGISHASMGMFPDSDCIDGGNSRQNRWSSFLAAYYENIYACKDYKKALVKYHPEKWDNCYIVTMEYQDMRGN